MVPFFLQFWSILRPKRPIRVSPQAGLHESPEAKQRRLDWEAEVEAMHKPPRSAWGGFKTEEEWLRLQESFAAHQKLYESGDRSHSSNTQLRR